MKDYKIKITILEKTNKLLDIKKTLKSEYVGLDDVIDELLFQIEPWYLFPNSQLRPNIINLWGMTSTGKTSLVLRIFELLGVNSVFKFDVGELASGDDLSLKSSLTTDMNMVNVDNDIPPVLIFDEFQLGNTISLDGGSIERSNLRIIWELFDTGKFKSTINNWQFEELYTLYNKINVLINKKHVVVKNFKVVSNEEDWKRVFCDDLRYQDDDDNADNLDPTNVFIDYVKMYPKTALIPKKYMYTIVSLCDEYVSEYDVLTEMLKLDGVGVLKFLKDIINDAIIPKEYDFSNSLIINIGNLDSVYYNSNNIDPDIDPDTLYDMLKDVKIIDVKKGLLDLYRPEQISRLGNNHIIYKSFTKKMYEDLISMELNKFKDKVKTKFGLDIEIEKDVNTMLYKESVFPTQGVRPIFSTITTLIDAYFSRIYVDIIKEGYHCDKIVWGYKKEEYILHFKDKDKDVIKKYPITLKVDIYRKSKKDDSQSLIAVHETGHILTSIYALNICPDFAISQLAEDNGGVTQFELPKFENKALLKNRLVCLVGGYVAEKYLFGDDCLSTGSYGDIEEVTNLALLMLKKYGMDGCPIEYSSVDYRNNLDSVGIDIIDMDRVARDWIEQAVEKAKEIITNNEKLFLEISLFLTNNSKIESKEIKKLVKQYGEDVIYKTKDNYYNYKNILLDKIKQHKK